MDGLRPDSNADVVMDQANYSPLVGALADRFGDRLKMIVLFGSRSRNEARPDSDHDIFAVIDGLPKDPLARQRDVTMALLPELVNLPERLSVIAKTSQELMSNLTPLVVDVCVDGVCLHGQNYFDTLRAMALQALRDSGLRRRRVAGDWMWSFPRIPKTNWELTWEGYREGV
jgi:predicted nucleotidyltransferase